MHRDGIDLTAEEVIAKGKAERPVVVERTDGKRQMCLLDGDSFHKYNYRYPEFGDSKFGEFFCKISEVTCGRLVSSFDF